MSLIELESVQSRAAQSEGGAFRNFDGEPGQFRGGSRGNGTRSFSWFQFGVLPKRFAHNFVQNATLLIVAQVKF